jgi:hypothetical protein
MLFDCPPATFKPRIAHDGWTLSAGEVKRRKWTVTTPDGDWQLFDTLGQACDFIRRRTP